MKITLDPNLERALLRAEAEGVVNTDIVDSKELSKKGKAVHDAITHLLKKGAKPPLHPASIALTAHSLSGFPKSSADSYLKSFREFQTGEEIATILQTAREKAALVDVINQAGEQLASGVLNVSDLSRSLDFGSTTRSGHNFESLSKRVGDKFTKPPSGHDIVSLPEISKATNGLAGIWVVGGEPGLGKSTLALQIALDVAREVPAAYIDIDGTGEAYFIDRLRSIYGNDIGRFKKATKSFFYRESIDDLDQLTTSGSFKAPGLIIVDSIQTLPVNFKYSKEAMDNWLRRFKLLSQRGYAMLLISEKSRAQYGSAELGGYKGTGDIEYSGTLCAHVLADDDNDDLLKFIIVKNRHGPRKGHIVNLIRDSEKTFWFAEENVRSYVDRSKKKR
jgi:hypothetical protein